MAGAAPVRRINSGGYFIGTGGGIRSDSGSTASQEIAWVADNFTATTVGGVTVYDLTTMAAT